MGLEYEHGNHCFVAKLFDALFSPRTDQDFHFKAKRPFQNFGVVWLP